MLLNHTGCGFTTFTDEELNAKLSKLTGDASPVPMRFLSYKDPVEHTKDQIKKVRSHPWIAKEVPVRGFIFDVDTGDFGSKASQSKKRLDLSRGKEKGLVNHQNGILQTCTGSSKFGQFLITV
jgi:carbonic anhydrase